MRRALLLFLAVVPALALGQNVTFRSANKASVLAINLAQCKGTPNSDLNLSDDMSADVTWTIKPINAAVAQGTYRIYVSSEQSQAGQPLTGTTGTGTDCQKKPNGDPLTTAQVHGNISYNGQTQTEQDISLATMVTSAGLNCTTANQPRVYVCVQQLDGGGNIVGYATASLLLDLTTPPAPTTPSTSAGDGALHVSCHAGSGDSVGTGGGYKAKATPTNTTMETKFSGENTSCDLEIRGLVNDQSYDVVVYRLNENHNPSAASPSASGTPILTYDYWNDYKGRERGGCGTVAGAGGLLAALAALAALASLRRRNS